VWACGIPTFFRLKRLQWAGHVVKTDDSTKSNECLGGRRSVEKPRSRWKDAVWRESSRIAPDTELEGGSSEDRRLEKGDLGGHGPTTGRSDTEESRRLSKTTK
jgi:hypothetical protein